jgi:Fe/S biogenesis protein NfuA
VVGGSVEGVSTESPTSPFATDTAAPPAEGDVITVTDVARAKLIELRDGEPEGVALGIRLEILSDEGADFTYDLSFQETAKAALTDVVRNHGGIRVIIPAKDLPNFEGATLDYELDGLVLRNPNKPRPITLEGLVDDDEVAAEVRSIVEHDVNPALAAHGGFVTFVGHDGDGRAYMTMGGGCHGCSMSRLTMLEGVQVMIKDKVPAITKVIDATDHATGATPYYQ